MWYMGELSEVWAETTINYRSIGMAVTSIISFQGRRRSSDYLRYCMKTESEQVLTNNLERSMEAHAYWSF